MLPKYEVKNFNNLLTKLINILTKEKEYEDIPDTCKHFKRVIQYNVNEGKKFRGMLTVMAFKHIAHNGTLNSKNLVLAGVLGWSVEFLQAACLITDDIMDGSETRRGKPCWYKIGNMGNLAFNDALFLENSVFKILKYYFENKTYYPKLFDAVHDVIIKTVLGQSKDTLSGFEKKFERLTMKNYKTIVKYKTSFYTFFLPIHLAYILAEIKNENLLEKIKDICLKLGEIFQIQDDYLDCFGDSEITGKIGTDIQEFKCTWLICKAIESADENQLAILKENYGSTNEDKIKDVKQTFYQLNLPELFTQEIYNLTKTVKFLLEDLENSSIKTLFEELLHVLVDRKK